MSPLLATWVQVHSLSSFLKTLQKNLTQAKYDTELGKIAGI